MCASVDAILELALCWTQVVRSSRKYLYPPSHIAGLYLVLYFTAFVIQSRALQLFR